MDSIDLDAHTVNDHKESQYQVVSSEESGKKKMHKIM